MGEAAGWTHHKSLDESRAILADFIKKDDVYALELKQTGRVIGSLGLHAVNNGEEYNPQRELGYVLSRDHWGKGLMSEAAARAVRYAFEEMALKNGVDGMIVTTPGMQEGIVTYRGKLVDKLIASYLGTHGMDLGLLLAGGN